MIQESSKRYQQVGIDRLIRLDWLECASQLVIAGNGRGGVKAHLQQHLRDQIPGSDETVRGSLDKTITILMRVWSNPPQGMGAFQTDGLRLLQRLPREDHLAVHWGMVMAVYPFWGAVAASVGRLLRLQETASVSQVQRRVREQYGERETVSRRVRYVLRAFVQWRVLRETSKKGVYSQGLCRSIDDLTLVAWLVEAFLHSQPDSTTVLSVVLDATRLFPFSLPRVPGDLFKGVSKRLEVVRQGMDQDLVALRRFAAQESLRP